jgi:two-component system, LytTR family, sensor kinase
MKKSIISLVHITFWSVIYITMYVGLISIFPNPFPPVGYNPFWTYGWLSIEILGGVLIPFYVFYFLSPKLFNKQNKLIWYSTAFVFLISYPAIIVSLTDTNNKIETTDYLVSFLFYMFFAFTGCLFRIFFKWIEQNKQRDNLEKQNLKSELELLKHQINPHFLFNTLNNVDSLITENNQKASLALNKLSQIMRYMIYETEKEKVPLKEEIDYIESYISLQKLRTTNENKIIFEITGNIENHRIAPMLLITFIENAFKHSSLKKTENSVIIKLNVLENQINFSCVNTLSCSPTGKEVYSGMGLELIKKRLELIYPKAYKLNINKIKQTFEVNLEIKTNAD